MGCAQSAKETPQPAATNGNGAHQEPSKSADEPVDKAVPDPKTVAEPVAEPAAKPAEAPAAAPPPAATAARAPAPAPAPAPKKEEPPHEEYPDPGPFVPITKRLPAEQMQRAMPKCFPLLIEDTTDADNQIALAGFCKDVFSCLEDICQPMGIFGVCPRHADLSFPLAFNKHIVKNRPDFRAFDPVKNAHEGTGLVPAADILAGRTDPKEVEADTDLVMRNEVRRTYASVMMSMGLDPGKKQSWEFIQRAFPMWMLPVCKDHLLSHHFFAREFLFDRGDLEGNGFGEPLSPKGYGKQITEMDGEVAATESGAYDRDADVKRGLAAARRQRGRKLVQDALDHWDRALGTSHLTWIEGCELISRAYLSYVTDVVIMAPCPLSLGHWSSLRACKRVWGMFFALDNAAEYGHWVMEEKAKNIFRNNFNTGLDEDGTTRMLHFIKQREIRAYFHPTELFKGDIGKKSWDVARVAVAPVREGIAAGKLDFPPLLSVYNCYNAAKSPTCDPQQISDPMIVFEYLNFANNLTKSTITINGTADLEEVGCMMPVASYGPAVVKEDINATEENYLSAVNGAKAKGLSETDIKRLVRREKVFVVKPSFEPLNNGCYVGMNLVNRMVPIYSKWLHSLLLTKPELSTPQEQSAILPIMEGSLKTMQQPPCCKPTGRCC